MWYAFIRWLVRNAFFRLGLGGLRSVDETNMPRSGAVIVAPVHFSYLDPPAVACGTRRSLTFMAKEELFRHGLFGWLIRSLGAFPVRRGESDTEAIRLTLRLLEEGRAVLMFPEGTRGNGTTLGPITRGIGMIAKRSGAPILPVGIVGTFEAWPKGAKKLKRHRITLVYGKPFTYEEITKGMPEREGREAFAKAVEAALIEACARGGLQLRTSPSGSSSTSASRLPEGSVPPSPEAGETPVPPTP